MLTVSPQTAASEPRCETCKQFVAKVVDSMFIYCTKCQDKRQAFCLALAVAVVRRSTKDADMLSDAPDDTKRLISRALKSMNIHLSDEVIQVQLDAADKHMSEGAVVPQSLFDPWRHPALSQDPSTERGAVPDAATTKRPNDQERLSNPDALVEYVNGLIERYNRDSANVPLRSGVQNELGVDVTVEFRFDGEAARTRGLVVNATTHSTICFIINTETKILTYDGRPLESEHAVEQVIAVRMSLQDIPPGFFRADAKLFSDRFPYDLIACGPRALKAPVTRCSTTPLKAQRGADWRRDGVR
jgi:hypothetical protein